jgi:NADPH:quinone reductase-like Zn-dependent oxidoreductase
VQVYDSVGKDTWEGSLDVVKLKGKVVFIGASSKFRNSTNDARLI